MADSASRHGPLARAPTVMGGEVLLRAQAAQRGSSYNGSSNNSGGNPNNGTPGHNGPTWSARTQRAGNVPPAVDTKFFDSEKGRFSSDSYNADSTTDGRGSTSLDKSNSDKIDSAMEPDMTSASTTSPQNSTVARPPAISRSSTFDGLGSLGAFGLSRGSRNHSRSNSGENGVDRMSSGPNNLSGGSNTTNKKGVSFISRFLSSNKKRASTFPVQVASASTPTGRTSRDGQLHSGSNGAAAAAAAAVSGPPTSAPRIADSPLDDQDRSSSSLAFRDDNAPAMDGLQMFRHDIDNIEFAPRVQAPSGYAKVKAKNKREREFDRLFLAQELRIDDALELARTKSSGGRGEAPDRNAVWSMAFSRDGKYLAAAGQNHSVKVWAVLSSLDNRDAQEAEEDEMGVSGAVQMKASVFRSTPAQTYTEHEGPVLDVSWSKNNFLLTTSQDRTVRLWHPSRTECLCVFKHASPVHAIAFHPKDDRFFLAGSKDSKLRLWSIPDKRVEFWANARDMITAVAFSPDGKLSFAGTVSGTISVFATETLKFSYQLAIGKKKSRVTGIDARHLPGPNDPLKLLVTSADSRIQLYNLRTRALELKLKGHKNDEVALRATIADDNQHIICGSEDKGGVYIWNVDESNEPLVPDKKSDKTVQRPLEFFEANAAKTTCALFAPRETRVLLGSSADPIYDICNPPPVKLVEREGSIASSRHHPNASNPSINDPGYFKQPKHAATLPIRPASPASSSFDIPGRPSIDNVARSKSITATTPISPVDGPHHTYTHAHSAGTHAAKTPAWHARNSHDDGAILVTASSTGTIRIYRSDCASGKRARQDAEVAAHRRATLRRVLTSNSNHSGTGGGGSGSAGLNTTTTGGGNGTSSGFASPGPSTRPPSVRSAKKPASIRSLAWAMTPLLSTSNRDKDKDRDKPATAESRHVSGGDFTARARRADSLASLSGMMPPPPAPASASAPTSAPQAVGSEAIERWRADVDGRSGRSGRSGSGSAGSLRRADSTRSRASVATTSMSTTAQSLVTANESPVRRAVSVRVGNGASGISGVSGVRDAMLGRLRAGSGETADGLGSESSFGSSAPDGRERGGDIPRSGSYAHNNMDVEEAEAEADAKRISDSTAGTAHTSAESSAGDHHAQQQTQQPALDRRGSSFANPLRNVGAQSFMFWNLSQYAPPPATSNSHNDDSENGDGEHLPPPALGDRHLSNQSALTDELSRAVTEAGAGEACPRCGGADVMVRESRGWTLGKSRSVVCKACGLERREG